MSSDLALSIAVLSGWVTLVVWLVWPSHGCHDPRCEKLKAEKDKIKR